MLTPLKALKQAVEILNGFDCLYCLVGGHAASLYRSQERVTRDVDFALVANDQERSREIAEQCIKMLGLEPTVGWIARNKSEPHRRSVCLITSKPPAGQLTGLVDIILPELPWVMPAVKRAQANRLDLGFNKVPVITPEDLIIAKCYSVWNSEDRFQDLDDLKEIFQSIKDLDKDYLQTELINLSLEIPEAVRKYARE